MSDDFDDDSFLVDDSFLRQVDDIAAKATSKPFHPSKLPLIRNAPAKAAHTGSVSGRGIAPQRPGSGAAGLGSFGGFSRASAQAGPSRPAAPFARHLSVPQSSSSGGFDDLSLPSESITAPGNIVVNRQAKANGSLLSSSRLGRSSSGNEGFMQTHLNFRRDHQSTKGKRWDRTAFAESGRRISAGKGKGQGKGKDSRWDADDDEEILEAEDDWGVALAPPPKPLVDPSKEYDRPRHRPDPYASGSYIYPTNRPKRDYQYEIVRACFTDNCLVALPTGLGKTFVAGVVMLNFYRWFPSGKIVFLAPTKPLVNQQIEACQLTCGIPSKDAAVMTGSSVSQKERARLWRERRVFYCTPQTLDNDLKKGSVDPQDIVLAVFDEAHKASGSYAYTTILAYITAHHPYFRVLALTATPGADVPKVQAVVDALHISRIEIREAEAPDIRKYMNEKRTEKHFVPMGSMIESFRDRWIALVKPNVVKLVAKDVLTDRDLDIKRLKPFRLTAKRMEITRNPNSGLKWCMGPLMTLEKMTRAMGYLLEFSLGMFHTALTEIAGGTTAEGKKAMNKGSANSMRNNFEFQKLLRDVEAEMNCIRIGKDGRTKADRHPKMQQALDLLLAHFTQAEEEERTLGQRNDTRAMVFCSFRECVLEVVDMLNDHSPVLKATKFVGQSQGKQEADKGFNQKDQKRTINDFKEGKFNILVSTSIGEEGLDIGEVDFVVIYDMPRQSIKLLQRVGRTGRKRDGAVHVLMSEDREDTNWDSAQNTHREIQEEILHSRNLELFEDVEALLCPGRFPECVEQEMPVDPWDPADQKVKRKLPASYDQSPPAKKARGHEIPDGASDGFKSVADLLRNAGKIKSKPRRKDKGKRERSPVHSETEEEDGDDGGLERVFADLSGKTRKKDAKKAAAPRQTKAGAKSKVPKKKIVVDPQSTESEAEVEDEEERKEREKREAMHRSGVDFFNVQLPASRRMTTPPASPPNSPPPSFPALAAHPRPSPKTDGSAECEKETLVDTPAPLALVRPLVPSKLTPGTAAAAGFTQVEPIDLSWDDAPTPDPKPALTSSIRPRSIGLARPKGSTPAAQLHPTRSAEVMPPPPLPIHRASPAVGTPSAQIATPGSEGTQYPVRRAGARPYLIPGSDEKLPDVPARFAIDGSPLLPQNRLRRRQIDASSSPAINQSPMNHQQARRLGRRPRVRAPQAEVQAFLDVNAVVSGSESPDEPLSDEETESDLRFANDFQATQAPKGYNQRAMYLAGLSTQAPQHGLSFKPRVDREAFLAKARKPVMLSDSEGSSENEYQLGSFVCDDEEEVSFDTQSDQMSCS